MKTIGEIREKVSAKVELDDAKAAKILFYDLETAKMKIEYETYSLKQYSNYLPPESIIRPVWIVCAAWKWMGESVSSTSVLKDPERFKEKHFDDYHVVKVLHELISSADILVAHNGDGFDWKIFQARCLYHNLCPAKPPIMIDTLKASRRIHKPESHSLRYLASYLGVEGKFESPDWDEVSKGNVEAIQYCERYCRQDIRTLVQVYERLKPYIPNHPNLNLFQKGVEHLLCKTCEGGILEKRGFRYTASGKYQSYVCKKCGAWMRGIKNLKSTEIR